MGPEGAFWVMEVVSVLIEGFAWHRCMLSSELVEW